MGNDNELSTVETGDNSFVYFFSDIVWLLGYLFDREVRVVPYSSVGVEYAVLPKINDLSKCPISRYPMTHRFVKFERISCFVSYGYRSKSNHVSVTGDLVRLLHSLLLVFDDDRSVIFVQDICTNDYSKQSHFILTVAGLCRKGE